MDTILMQTAGGDTKLSYSNEILKSLIIKTEYGETEFRPLICETLAEEDHLKAKKELSETDENVKKGLRRLRKFLTIQDLPSRIDDYFLLQFLRCQKFNFKNSEQKLTNYWNMRQELVNLFESIDLDKLMVILDHQVIGLLPYRDKHGRTIIFARASLFDPAKFEGEDLISCAFALCHFAASFPPTSVNGFCYVGDGEFASTFHMFSAFPLWRKCIPYQKSLPYRIQRADIFKANLLFRWLYRALTPLLPTKITKRVHLHGSDLDELAAAFHPSILPYEFGGTMGPLSNKFYRERFLDYVERFKAECIHFKRRNKNS